MYKNKKENYFSSFLFSGSLSAPIKVNTDNAIAIIAEITESEKLLAIF